MKFIYSLYITKNNTFTTGKTSWFFKIFIIFNNIHITLINRIQRLENKNEKIFFDFTSTINAKSLTYSFSVSINSIILCLKIIIIIIIISYLYNNKHQLFYLRFSPYLVRSSTGSSVVVNDNNVVWSLLSFKDNSSVCSLWLSFGITVIVDDDDVILVVEISSTDGVVIDKAAGIWKSLAENPETILIGA